MKKAKGGYLLVEVVLAIGLFAAFSLGAISLMGIILPFSDQTVKERQAQGIAEYVKWVLEQKGLLFAENEAKVFYAYTSPKGIVLQAQSQPTNRNCRSRFKVTLLRDDSFLNANTTHCIGISGIIEYPTSKGPLCIFRKILSDARSE